MADLAGRAVIADQVHDSLEVQPGGEQPADRDVVHGLGNLVATVDEVPGRFG
jgi:hypothetical protein